MKVAIIDDSNYARKTMRGYVEDLGWEVVGEFASGEEAIDGILRTQPDLITLDNILTDMTGIDVLKAIRGYQKKPMVIMVSAVGQQSAIEEALSLGVLRYLVKPIDANQFREAIDSIA